MQNLRFPLLQFGGPLKVKHEIYGSWKQQTCIESEEKFPIIRSDYEAPWRWPSACRRRKFPFANIKAIICKCINERFVIVRWMLPKCSMQFIWIFIGDPNDFFPPIIIMTFTDVECFKGVKFKYRIRFANYFEELKLSVVIFPAMFSNDWFVGFLISNIIFI